MHYSWVEAVGFLKWRWACSCGEFGKSERRFSEAAAGQKQHTDSMQGSRA